MPWSQAYSSTAFIKVEFRLVDHELQNTLTPFGQCDVLQFPCLHKRSNLSCQPPIHIWLGLWAWLGYCFLFRIVTLLCKFSYCILIYLMVTPHFPNPIWVFVKEILGCGRCLLNGWNYEKWADDRIDEKAFALFLISYLVLGLPSISQWQGKKINVYRMVDIHVLVLYFIWKCIMFF